MKTAYSKKAFIKFRKLFTKNIYYAFFKETSLTYLILSNSWTHESVSERTDCR